MNRRDKQASPGRKTRPSHKNLDLSRAVKELKQSGRRVTQSTEPKLRLRDALRDE